MIVGNSRFLSVNKVYLKVEKRASKQVSVLQACYMIFSEAMIPYPSFFDLFSQSLGNIIVLTIYASNVERDQTAFSWPYFIIFNTKEHDICLATTCDSETML